MSQDIRSFFTPMAKKAPVEKKPVKLIDSDDENIINSPTPKKKPVPKNKKRKIIDSDSEDESKKAVKRVRSKEELKPVSASDIFGAAPVKQKKGELNEKFKKKLDEEQKLKDEMFKRTLAQLDDDDDLEMDVINKTIDETLEQLDSGTAEVKKSEKKISGKRKKEEFDDSGMDPDEERHERRRHSAVLYQKYLHRPKPAHKGEKELPKGKPDCLKGLCFLKTGVLDSLEHDDFDALIKEHGGRTVNTISKKVNYLVIGEEPGPAKIEKAHAYGIIQINEDELLDLILTKSGMKPKYAQKCDEEVKVKKEKKEKTPVKIKERTPVKESKNSKNSIKPPNLNKLSFEAKTIKKEETNKREDKQIVKNEDKLIIKKEDIQTIKRIKKEDEKQTNNKEEKQIVKNEDKLIIKNEDIPTIKRIKKETTVKTERITAETPAENLSWTEKYKPSDIKSIIGQQGDKSNMHKLLSWLQNWHKNHLGKNKPKLVKPSPWAKSDDGSYFKCALLSGPPGIGKTTTATLVAKHLGFDVVEMNASDTRSKRMLHEEVSQLLSTKSISSYFKDGSAPTTKHVLLMDEVDGMAGNEDRGGIQELIGLIKNTQVPIICMCNDRQHQKMRSLVNYCMDLRFARPRIEQIKGAMMSVCFKEDLKIHPDTLSEIISATGMDVRQTLNNLSMWSSADKNITSEVGQKESKASMKDTPLGPWEVIRKVFSEEEHKNMSIPDRSRLFFHDYSIGPLFVQENYLQVVPHCPKKAVLERVAAAADSISLGDVVEKKIRSTNNWSLLESQAMFASVLPGHYMEGHFGGQINFPSWLGKNSKRTKFQRSSSELQAHMRTSISGSKLAVNLDYVYHLCNNIVRPLAKEGTNGIDKSMEVMKSYNLLREDLDSILELSQWPKKKDPMAMVESKVKAAFTRAYNKEGPVLPYAVSSVTKKKTTASTQEENVYGEEEGAESETEEVDDISKDAMIKEKKKPAARGGKKDAGDSSSKKRKPSTRGKKK